jgi:hypothetical protein
MENQLTIGQKLNETALQVLGNESLQGFERAYQIANAINVLSELLTPEYMKPIMALQGNKLGFLTDKDKAGGYPELVVKKCLIEAVLSGLQPCGNHFNIIAGNMYPTKEGCGYRLNNITGLNYKLVCGLPKINPDKTSAAVDVHVTWSINGEAKEETVPIPIKMDAYTSVDAIIGKATRKGRAWLLSTVTGIEVTDGEVTDAVVIEDKKTIGHLGGTIPPAEKENERMELLIRNANTVAQLELLEKDIKPGHWHQTLYKSRMNELLDQEMVTK